MSAFTNYFRESFAELKKVSWPTKNQTINYSLVVIGISLGLAIFLGVLDYVLNLGLAEIIR